VTVDTRQRIIEVTAELLQRSPAEPVSTRAICEAAGVSAPTLYHHFGDKDGLYDAVVTYGFEFYLAAKHALAPTGDPVVDLCHAWDAHVDFGVTHPALYALMYGTARVGEGSPASREAHTLLTGLLARVAQAGQLRIDLEAATAAIEAACVGATLQAIRGDQGADAATLLRDTVFDSVVTGRPQATHVTQSTHSLQTDTVTGTASRLAALLGEQPPGEGPLTPEEQSLLTQWLRRLSDRGQPRPAPDPALPSGRS
jgi:AcrR family transcriptional regulator